MWRWSIPLLAAPRGAKPADCDKRGVETGLPANGRAIPLALVGVWIAVMRPGTFARIGAAITPTHAEVTEPRARVHSRGRDERIVARAQRP